MINDFGLQVRLYEPKDKTCWDEFVCASKNGVFLFQRDYLDYHADRFRDMSLMFFQEDRMIAVMPANETDNLLVSHGGLTFGGIISDNRMKTPLMLEVFSALTEYLRRVGIRKLVYKAIPHIYHDVPAEEDLYGLFLHNASLFRRDLSSSVLMTQRPPFAELRKRGIKRSKSEGVEVERSHDFVAYMAIVEGNLRERYATRPVHTANELELLANRFPDNIKLFAACKKGEMLAGVIIYESRNVAHAQYIAATPEGKKVGALDCIMNVLLNETYLEKRYFDFGISTVDNGHTLNVSLIQNKEGFGGRATVYDVYELKLENEG